MFSPTPIYDALKQYAGQTGLRLHMPGHIGKAAVTELESAVTIDVTEIPGMDDLHLPQEIIKQSLHLLAGAFGAAQSFFLVNGATSGIQALFLALVKEGDKVLIPRNAHRSFFGGMVLSGAFPVYIPVQTMDEPGAALAVTCEDITALLNQSNMVFLVSPSYYGTSSDLAEIARVVHSVGGLLLVDEAHGSHFGFCRRLPPTAMQCGADAAVNGLHKTLPVLNQGACLHLGSGLSGNRLVKNACSLLTTTSPSYPIMASIESARAFMEEKGETRLTETLDCADKFREKMHKHSVFRCYYEEMLQIPGVKALDGLKIFIGTQNSGLTGYELGKQLREKYKIQVEIEDSRYILAMFSIFHRKEDWDYFYLALNEIAKKTTVNNLKHNTPVLPPDPTVVVSPRVAFLTPVKSLPLKDCCGHIAGEMVAAYPPGIPCVLPGELITEPLLDYLKYLQKTGARLQGPKDDKLEQFDILEL